MTHRCKSINELKARMTDLDMTLVHYIDAGGTPIDEDTQQHELIQITPQSVLDQWKHQEEFLEWTSKQIREKMKNPV